MTNDGPYREEGHNTERPRVMRQALGRDGRINVVRKNQPQSGWLHDLYHYLLVTSWLKLLLMFFAGYLVANALFAALYLLGGDQCVRGVRPGSFLDAFFFSVQTMSTIGYGRMEPLSTYANVLVTVEAFMGLLAFALATGLVFSKFARPSARVLFAKKAVVALDDGRPVLMVRMANTRGNQIYEASVRLSLLRDVVNAEGELMRRFFDMNLTRERTPVFAMSWTAIHVIDEQSPLYGVTEDELAANEAMLLVSLHGTDETFVQPVHARAFYFHDDIQWGARYIDVIHRREEEGILELDYGTFHDTEPLDDAARARIRLICSGEEAAQAKPSPSSSAAPSEPSPSSSGGGS
ncbi:MAG: hypothetical protein KC503_18530 [Myxococcales bacterium]|nr:hypothetical protein [Myxococcales bacterium]